MNANAPIIDVTPIEHSSTRLRAQATGQAQARAGSQGNGWAQDSKAAPHAAGRRTYTYTRRYNVSPNAAGAGAYAAKSPSSAIGGLAQVVIGAGLISIGVPMLLLPGPGLLMIAAGGFLVSRGLGSMRP